MREKQTFNNLRTDDYDFEEVINDNNCTRVNHSNLHRDLAQIVVSESHSGDEPQQCQEQQNQSCQSRTSSRSNLNRKKTAKQARKHADTEKERRREHAIIRALTRDCFTEEDVAKYFGPNSNKTLENLTYEDIDGISCQKIKNHYDDTVYVNRLLSEIDQLVELARSLGIEGVEGIQAVRPAYSDYQIHMAISELTSEALNFDKQTKGKFRPEEIAERFRPKYNEILRRAHQIVPLDNPLSLNDSGGGEEDNPREQYQRKGRYRSQIETGFQTGRSNPKMRKPQTYPNLRIGVNEAERLQADEDLSRADCSDRFSDALIIHHDDELLNLDYKEGADILDSNCGEEENRLTWQPGFINISDDDGNGFDLLFESLPDIYKSGDPTDELTANACDMIDIPPIGAECDVVTNTENSPTLPSENTNSDANVEGETNADIEISQYLNWF